MSTSASGYHVNSHHLVDIIKNEMLKNGWTIRSTITAGRDYVFYSAGSDGYQDLYIRVAAGLYDYRCEGRVQKPDPDGYTEYVNFLAYQFFPTGGAPEDGSNEIGRHGPVLYMVQGEDSNTDTEEYDMIASKTTGARRFSRVNDSTTFNTYTRVTDGHSKIYYDNNGTTRRRINLEDESGTNTASISGLSSFTSLTPASGFGAYYVDPFTDYHYIYVMNNLNPSTISFHNLTLNTFGKGATAPWNTSSSQGIMVKGMARDGFTRLYTARGSDTTSWAHYTIETNTWSSLLTAPPDGWGTSGIDRRGHAIMVPKEITGYTNDRLYTIRGDADTDFYSIAIGDDGEPTGGWTTHAVTPQVATTGSNLFFLDNAIYFIAGSVNVALYKWLFPATATSAGSWTTVRTSFFTAADGSGGTVGDGTVAYLHYHLVSRVRVSEGLTNQHWVVADADRVVVATKDNFNKYWYCYAGLYDTFSDTRVTQLTTAAPATSTVLEVTDASIFKIGEKYIIVDTVGGSTHVSYAALEASDNLFAGLDRKFGPSETVTVSSINTIASTITLSSGLTRSYATGSKIGKDPQPVMVRAEDYNEAYVLNNLNLLDGHNSKDPPYQRYRLMPAYELTEENDNIHRNNAGLVYPIVLRDSGLNSVTGAEVRGTLRGVYRGGGSFVNGRIYTINGQDYVALIPSDIGTFAEGRGKVLIGPLE